MLPSERIGIAAHMHVLLRRKTGRVTDTQWMADNAEYAREIVRIARLSAKEDGHTELIEWADKLELAMAPQAEQAALAGRSVSVTPSLGKLLASVGSPAPDNGLIGQASRYVRGLR